MKHNLYGKAEWVEDILSMSDTGLWSIVLDSKAGKNKMIASPTMLDLLGLDEHPTEEECYNHWWNNVDEKYKEYVETGVEKMCLTHDLLEVQYCWHHPKLGKIFVRCAGKVEKDQDGIIEIRGYHQNITELEMLKKENKLSAEELKKLSKEQKRYNDLVRSVICGISQYHLSTNGEMRFKQANQETMRILGYTEEEFWRKKVWKIEDIIHPEDKWLQSDRERTLRKVGDKISYEYQILRKNGENCWILGNAELIRDIDEEIVVQSVFMDVTDQKRLEIQNQRLNEQSEAWRQSLRDSLKNTDIFEVYYYPKERVMSIPEEVSKKYKCENCYTNMPESFVEGVVDPECQQGLTDVYNKIHNGSKTADGEFALTGKKVWFHVTFSVISYDEQGKPSLVVGIIKDISDKKTIELENIQLQYIYNYAINHDYEYICILDLETRQYTLRYSRIWDQKNIPTSGIIDDELIKNLHETFGGEEERFMLKNILDKLEDGKDIHSVYYRSANQRHKEARYSWFDSEKKTLLITVRDIEEMWLQEEENKRKLRAALKDAKHANAAKSDFLSRMSHDIRTPLNAVIGMVDIAKKYSYDTLKVEECLNQISSSSNYLYLLINDILDMSKIENGKLELNNDAFVIHDFMKNVLAIIKPLVVDKRHTLTVIDKGIEHQKVEADYLRLQQLLINILSNAVKYTNPGGKIEFGMEEIACTREGYGCYRFTIKDNGIGMDKEFLPSIFVPFERKDSKRVGQIEGSGLGMAIAKNIANMMDGDIVVESELNVGSTFTITVFMKLQTEDSGKEFVQVEKEIPSFKGKNILLVEDNIVNREIAIEILSATEAKIEAVEDGQKALKRVEEVPEGYYSMIFMDIRMPIMDGYISTQKIRALNREDAKHIPIIAMTADAFAEDIKRAKEAGMNDHIAKPINIDKLYDTMKRWK